MKTLSLLTRRADLSPEAFRRYYEETHCHLAIRHFPYRRYIRNYLSCEVAGLDFDCISEFQMQTGFAAKDIMQSHSRALMRDDERNFMRPDRIRVATVEESVLLDRSVAVEASVAPRHALLLSSAGLSREDFPRELKNLAQALSRDVLDLERLSLDLLTPMAGSVFPFDAVLWMQFAHSDSPRQKVIGRLPGLLAALSVETHTSSQEALERGYVSFIP